MEDTHKAAIRMLGSERDVTRAGAIPAFQLTELTVPCPEPFDWEARESYSHLDRDAASRRWRANFATDSDYPGAQL